ncbi:transmembrane protein 269 isoform X2 [Microcebus murinus]|uniref:transmembrane protein 269 isoform X2 n=1 Tax=Microcebus murinus TaxID=30608 RepID=UPI003F6ADF84
MLCPRDLSLHSSCTPYSKGRRQGQGTSSFLSHAKCCPQRNELYWKNVINALSLVNMVLGLFSIFCCFSRKSHCASWMILVGFLVDITIRTMTRHVSICSRSALLLGANGLLNGLLTIIYVSATSLRLCFYSTGVPLAYKGLPCPYASCVLASMSLLTKGNTFILCCMASLMVLFMMDQSYYPHDAILESDNWKKVVYVGGVIMLLFSPLSIMAFYYLVWSLSYIFLPEALWGKAACLR